MFRTQYQARDRVHCTVGSRIKDIYKPVIDRDGHMELEVAGSENLYDYIQSHKDSCDIHLILKRYQDGDVAALSRAQGLYGDFTEMPQTYAEALNAVISAENYFQTLPVETRAKFNHDFKQFLASMDKPGFAEAMGFVVRADGKEPSAPAEAAPAAGAQKTGGNDE